MTLFKENRNQAESQYGPIEDWCTQDVTNMATLFFSYQDFNEPIGDWDVSRVTDMAFMVSCIVAGMGSLDSVVDLSSCMVCPRFNLTHLPQFYFASSFNQDISSWDVSSVTTMKSMVSFIVVDSVANSSQFSIMHGFDSIQPDTFATV